MRQYLFFIAVLALVHLLTDHGTVASLLPPERGYNVLMLLPFGGKSHLYIFQSLATELAKRGHKVTILSMYPPPSDHDQNITYIEHGLPHFKEEEMNMFDLMDDESQLFQFLAKILPLIARDLYKVERIQELYQHRDQFDLVMIDSMFNEAAFPFSYKKPLITVATAGLDPIHSAKLGNIQNPAYASCAMKEYSLPMSFVDRCMNIFQSIAVAIAFRYYITPKVQFEISKQFPDLPSLPELERNQSLALLNSHFSLSTPLPLVPGQIEVGGMHCRPGEPLPQDINDFISGRVPVIYFSLGSVTRGTTIPQRFQDVLITAFSKLPYKVLWKFEEERQDLPHNIMIRKWLPQQDVLAHPNVAVFISHCGQLSFQEAIYHATPVLALPIYADQPRNAERLQTNGLAKILKWKDLTEELIIETVTELVTNHSYKSEISRISAISKDQPESPLERAVFWTEYVLRHSGAVHLRSPERDLSWVEVLHLDILLALHLALFLMIWSIKKMIKFCFRSNISRKMNKNKRD